MVAFGLRGCLTTFSILAMIGIIGRIHWDGGIRRSVVIDVKSTASLPSNQAERLAYMTFLTGTMADQSDINLEHDRYFIATRILGYQLMHQAHTKTRADIPFVVLVTSDIPAIKQTRLREDGAIVIQVDYLRAKNNWIQGEMPEWRDVMTKLRAWELTQFSRVAFFDSDMILNRCMDDVFQDPGSSFVPSFPDRSIAEDEGRVPESYVLATVGEVNPFHNYPPRAEKGDFKDENYFNAGFFLFAPDHDMFRHFTTLMELQGRFDPRYPEQNLLNYAYRREGKMPWQNINSTWNIRFPSIQDKDAGVASLHDKFWSAHMDKRLQPYYDSVHWNMQYFFQLWDRAITA
ncbi:nucleotide-diphospho-sugar transferase [Aureobasidium pullulans]|uniref:Nucleotide-diphospho-sugar transferase n=1 Tax=Aureobasidium pullulans TaxID=5580 RepID=A0A4T0B2K9_AURPU|nr:nucleotide-diphospho-sugar transferase [Aureobasidium pullulans]